jgi:hypothetical protein
MTSINLVPLPLRLDHPGPITYLQPSLPSSSPSILSPTIMSFMRQSTSIIRQSARFASTTTSAYVRKPASSSTGRKPPTPSSASTTSRAALSSSKPPQAAASVFDDVPPLPSFDDVGPSARASASSSTAPAARASGSTGGYRDAPTAPAPLSTFPDENYTSLPDASGAPSIGGGWDTSFSGLSFQPFEKDVAEILLKEVTPAEIEVKPGESAVGIAR